MHLKNFSMLLSDIGWLLSPAYDLLNVQMILPEDKEDTALLLGGKKERFTKLYFDKFGEVLKLNVKQINTVYKRLNEWIPKAVSLIDKSFLSHENRMEYVKRLKEKSQILIT